MPVGVWNVRENVRAALRGEPARFSTLGETLAYLRLHLDIPVERWMEQSRVLQGCLLQRTLADF